MDFGVNLYEDVTAFLLDCECHAEKQSGGIKRLNEQLAAVAASGYGSGSPDGLTSVAGEVFSNRVSIPQCAGE